MEVRQQCCDYISANVSKFLDFISNDFGKYLTEMRKPMKWGGDVEIIAMQEIFGVRIQIYSSSATDPVRLRVVCRSVHPNNLPTHVVSE